MISLDSDAESDWCQNVADHSNFAGVVVSHKCPWMWNQDFFCNCFLFVYRTRALNSSYVLLFGDVLTMLILNWIAIPKSIVQGDSIEEITALHPSCAAEKTGPRPCVLPRRSQKFNHPPRIRKCGKIFRVKACTFCYIPFVSSSNYSLLRDLPSHCRFEQLLRLLRKLHLLEPESRGLWTHTPLVQRFGVEARTRILLERQAKNKD